MNDVCFVDTETTGLDPDRHEIWEVGLITHDGKEHCWQLPVDLGRADPIALTISGYHDRRWTSLGVGYQGVLSTRKAFASSFVQLTRGAHLAGAVVSFDAERLWKLLRDCGQCPMWHYHLIDVEALAAGWVAAKVPGDTLRIDRPDGTTNHIDGRPPWNSTDLSRAVGVNPDDFARHTALGDARWAKAIYGAVMTPQAPVVEANLTCPSVHFHPEMGLQHCSRDEGHVGWHESVAMAWNDRGGTSIRIGALGPSCGNTFAYETRPSLVCLLAKGHDGDHCSEGDPMAPRWPNLDEEPF